MTPTLPDALALLQRTSGLDRVPEDDAVTLLDAVRAAADALDDEALDGIGRALLDQELQTLMWPPQDGARLVRALLRHPSTELLEQGLVYLSMYFQELDDDIAACRVRLGEGAAATDVAPAVIAAIDLAVEDD